PLGLRARVCFGTGHRSARWDRREKAPAD
ncbi:hypothetical protein STRIP9103_06596, partial [Streptomyces ipomoeae 91-03]